MTTPPKEFMLPSVGAWRHYPEGSIHCCQCGTRVSGDHMPCELHCRCDDHHRAALIRDEEAWKEAVETSKAIKIL